MSDIVERLRQAHSVKSWQEADAQRAEAADEIGRLLAENAKLREVIRQKDANAVSSGLLFDDIARLRDAAEAERDALLADAERYRWLRQVDRCEQWENLLMVRPITRTEDVDAAIDAARKAGADA